MQNNFATANGGNINYISSPNQEQSDGGYGYTSLYSSIFPPKTPLFSFTPSDCSTDEENSINSPIAADSYLPPLEFAPYSPHSRFVTDHQEYLDHHRHNLCLNRLCGTAKLAENLRQENINLRMANLDLNKRLSLVIQSSLQNTFASPADRTSPPMRPSVADGFRRMRIAEAPSEEVAGGSPTSVIENHQVERTDVDRVSLPKSISVRSNVHLKALQAGGSNGGRVRAPNRVKTVGSTNEKQKVYVRGVQKEEQPLELEVYNQGMFKTELCNKWQETGECPYGAQCQFAHGIKELRPVIRHPRYKTEVCRMVLAGDPCPYGHRCHFRHALTDQERLMRTLNPNAFNLNR